jgi:preprotein translocase subunit YajC
VIANFFQTLIAETAPASNAINSMAMPVLLLVIFYFLLIRPQQKQRKEQQARISALQAGDKVVTIGGAHGLVHNVKEKTVVIKIADNTMVEFDKVAIASVAKKDA